MKYNITDFKTIKLYIFSYAKHDYIIHKYQKVNDCKFTDSTGYQFTTLDLQTCIRCLSGAHNVCYEVINNTLEIFFQ